MHGLVVHGQAFVDGTLAFWPLFDDNTRSGTGHVLHISSPGDLKSYVFQLVVTCYLVSPRERQAQYGSR